MASNPIVIQIREVAAIPICKSDRTEIIEYLPKNTSGQIEADRQSLLDYCHANIPSAKPNLDTERFNQYCLIRSVDHLLL